MLILSTKSYAGWVEQTSDLIKHSWEMLIDYKGESKLTSTLKAYLCWLQRQQFCASLESVFTGVKPLPISDHCHKSMTGLKPVLILP